MYSIPNLESTRRSLQHPRSSQQNEGWSRNRSSRVKWGYLHYQRKGNAQRLKSHRRQGRHHHKCKESCSTGAEKDRQTKKTRKFDRQEVRNEKKPLTNDALVWENWERGEIVKIALIKHEEVKDVPEQESGRKQHKEPEQRSFRKAISAGG